jgi:secreted PhoX family phosphatase
MTENVTTRRSFLQAAAAIPLGFAGLHNFLAGRVRGAEAMPPRIGFGPLLPDPNGILELPSDFSCRVISRVGERMDDGLFVPGDPDGMAAFPGPSGTTVVIRNHELTPYQKYASPFGKENKLLSRIPRSSFYDYGKGEFPCIGGTTTLVYDTEKCLLKKQYLSLAGTINNCAGGPTPWNTWITCEETEQRSEGALEKDHGYAFEVPARPDGQLAKPLPLTAMGRFRREAVAVDPRSSIIYQTEDVSDGLIYRFIPTSPGEPIKGGKLQALAVRDKKGLDARNWTDLRTGEVDSPVPPGEPMAVEWIDLDEVHAPKNDLRIRGFEKGAARFARAEGMWFGRNCVFFCCTDGGRTKTGQIWRYTPSLVEGTPAEADHPGSLQLFLEPNDSSLLQNGDNITVAPWGDLFVCEDGPGEQFLVGITPEGSLYKFARNVADTSEFAGAVFSPDGSTLFVNLQNTGLTIAITGPWRSSV